MRRNLHAIPNCICPHPSSTKAGACPNRPDFSALKPLAAAVLAAALGVWSGASSAAYVEPGFIMDSQDDDAYYEAAASWVTGEYAQQWGLHALYANSAYALGYHGQGVAVGVFDSGPAFQTHESLTGPRFHSVHVSGTYGSSGNRYQQGVDGLDLFGNGSYEKGEAFETDGVFKPHVNDLHGTAVTSVLAANRDGCGFHGIAWGADVFAADTGGTDHMTYGPLQDYDFLYASWSTLAQTVEAQNGKDRGGVINNSYGTDLKIDSKGSPLPLNSVPELEYELFLSMKLQGEGRIQGDAAWNAIKDTNVVQVFAAGNSGMKNPSYRVAYPYFHPEAETQWLAATSIAYAGESEEGCCFYKHADDNGAEHDAAGIAKWWTVSTPGFKVLVAAVTDDVLTPSSPEQPLGSPIYGDVHGTSFAAPMAVGALAIVMSRYPNMTAPQARDVLLTTARQTNFDGSSLEGWTAQYGTPDAIYGWGIPNLDKAMYGPGQFLGEFDYKVADGTLDVWKNSISQTGLDARRVEDEAWMTATAGGTNLSADGYVLDYGAIPGIEDSTISQADAEKWRAEYYKRRADSIAAKLADNAAGYQGSLVKRGGGTLVLLGDNTYRGGTTVKDGTLLGFAESFGVTGSDAAATENGRVVVEGGTFGVLSYYNDAFTKYGLVASKWVAVESGKGEAKALPTHKVDIDVKQGGTLRIEAGQSVRVGSITLRDGASVTTASMDAELLEAAYRGEAQAGELIAEDSITLQGGSTEGASAETDSAFFTSSYQINGSTLTGAVERDASKSFETYTRSGNGRAIARALEASDGAEAGTLKAALIGGTKTQVADAYESLGDDALLNTRNVGIVNNLTLLRAVKDQAAGTGVGRTSESADGTWRMWVTGVGSWATVDYGASALKNDFYAALVGAEHDVGESTKAGLFFGAGRSRSRDDGSRAASGMKFESADFHLGLYGMTEIPGAAFQYGIAYMHQAADVYRTLRAAGETGWNKWSADGDYATVYGEGTLTAFRSGEAALEPYLGIAWIHASSDGQTESVGGMTFKTTPKDQDLQTTALGLRGSFPVNLGQTKITVTGDAAWHHFFGDTEAEGAMELSGSGTAMLKGGELNDMASLGLGVEARVGESTTIGISYTGTWNGDVCANGLSANVRIVF